MTHVNVRKKNPLRRGEKKKGTRVRAGCAERLVRRGPHARCSFPLPIGPMAAFARPENALKRADGVFLCVVCVVFVLFMFKSQSLHQKHSCLIPLA